MTKRAILALFAIVLITSMYGCGNLKEADLDKMSSEFEAAYDNVAVLDAGNACKKIYDTCSDTRRSVIECYMQSVSVKLSFVKEDDSFTITANYSVPDTSSVARALWADKDFLAERKSLIKTKASEDEINECINNYINRNLILGKDLDKTEQSVNVEVSGGDKDQISDAVFEALSSSVSKVLQQFILYDFSEKVVTEDSATDNEVADLTGVIDMNDFSDFTCKIDKNNVLIRNITILQGEEAMAKFSELSDSNLLSVEKSNKIYYVEYEVVNLNKSRKLTVDNLFHLAQDGCILQNTGLHVAGLKERVSIKPYHAATMTTCLVGPADADLFCYGEKLKGVRRWSSDNLKR